jgi:hypothetical protein
MFCVLSNLHLELVRLRKSRRGIRGKNPDSLLCTPVLDVM